VDTLRLIPRDERFFELLERQVSVVGHAAELLEQFVADPVRNAEKAAEIQALEQEGDRITREALQKINLTFVTPLDREDIHALASALDDILDAIDQAADRIRLYRISARNDNGAKLATILREAVDYVGAAIRHLRNLKQRDRIRKLCVEINRKENQGDYANRAAVAALFDMVDAPLDAIKWREIYETIERALDECEDIAGVIEQVLLKNS